MTMYLRSAVAVAALLAARAVAAPQSEAAAKQALFERVFGSHARLDPAMVARVKGMAPGTRYYVPRGPDRPAEVWFLDTDKRHQPAFQPILVRVIDEDGDLADGGEPDHKDDLYLADWRADGTIDSVVDYLDEDGDGDADEMGIFFFEARNAYVGREALCVWWGRDLGDDNRLWYDVNYTYQQPDCQWRTHFGGDEMFCKFALTPDAERWEPVFENPFLFYDMDRDGESEVVVRLSGKGEHIECLRYSFDADGRSSPAVPHHYDFSLTALAPGSRFFDRNAAIGTSALRLPPSIAETRRIRGIPTGPFAAHDRALAFCNAATWARVLLTWDENDLNTDAQYEKDSRLRWEGVIAHPSKDFPQIGGPTCGPYNKRNELDLAPSGPVRLYYDLADRRIHLRGADEAWIDVDYNLDRKPDMRYTYRDADGDGVLEVREVDADADGKADLVLRRDRPAVEDVPLVYGQIAEACRVAMTGTRLENNELIDLMEFILRHKEPAAPPDAARQFFVEKLAAWLPEARVGERMRASRATGRYYQDLVRDRLFVRVLRFVPTGEAATGMLSSYASGDYRAVTKSLQSLFAYQPVAQTRMGVDDSGGGWGMMPGIRLENPRRLLREDEIVVVPVEQIRKIAPGFDPKRVAVMGGERWIDWRRIPHQVDTAGPGGREELCFLASVEPESRGRFWLAAAPKGEKSPPFPARTATAQDWVPPNIGWESERVCYRAYWGQFDFFGKKAARLILPGIGRQSYHEEVEWGIDALNVKDTPGLGGITLYVGDQAYPAYSPEGKGIAQFTKRSLASGPIRTTIEIVVDKVGPYRVQMRCTAVAGRQETIVAVLVTGPPTTEPVYVAPGFTRLDAEHVILDDAAGVYATWGCQTPVIGTVGMGLVFAPDRFAGLVETPGDRRIRLRATVGREVSYLLVGDWLRGRPYPRCPTIGNWHEELRALAIRFRHPMTAEVIPPQRAR